MCQRDSLTPDIESAWPRPQGFQHKMTLSAGTDVAASEQEADMARSLVHDGPKQVVKLSSPIQIVPNAMEDFHDPIAQVSPSS
jgi:hypothetical protein